MDISDTQIEKFQSVCEQAARAGGAQLLKWLGKINVREKNPGDLVTEADFESQQAIRQCLAEHFPDHHFVGEEDDGALNAFDTTGFCWIVDPLDGTINFVHQLRSFSVSVALAFQGEVIVGTVFDPVLDECYSAAKGKGASLNGEPIRCSDCVELEKTLLVCSFNSRIAPESAEVRRFLTVMQKAGSIRRLGSAALNLCYVACGRLDGYWADSLSIWDVAAGVIIHLEAGGVLSHINGGKFDLQEPRFVASANSKLQQQLLPLMQVEES